jgi:hypothetical protein
MNDYTELNNPVLNPQPEQVLPDSPSPSQEPEVPAAATDGAVNGNGTRFSRYVEAGRKGARRVHQLIQEGRLYEQEHGLKRGRQRLRQLLQQGKLYEQEHGLSPRRRARRLSSDQVVRRLLDALVRIARPSYRAHLLRLIEALEGATREGTV